MMRQDASPGFGSADISKPRQRRRRDDKRAEGPAQARLPPALLDLLPLGRRAPGADPKDERADLEAWAWLDLFPARGAEEGGVYRRAAQQGRDGEEVCHLQQGQGGAREAPRRGGRRGEEAAEDTRLLLRQYLATEDGRRPAEALRVAL